MGLQVDWRAAIGVPSPAAAPAMAASSRIECPPWPCDWPVANSTCRQCPPVGTGLGVKQANPDQTLDRTVPVEAGVW